MPNTDTAVSAIKFDDGGLVAAIAVDHISNDVLMLAWMNRESFVKTLETGEAHYWSRSRQSLWHKGATSGAIQIVKEIKTDCDNDALILVVEQKGAGACHTGRRSCFFQKLEQDQDVFLWRQI